MPAENALGFLRMVAGAKTMPAAVVIAGPHAFLREYLLDTLKARMAREGLQYRAFQIANASDAAEVIEELRAPDLFAPKRMLVCRVMRSFRERGGDEAAEGSGREARGADNSLGDLIASSRGPGMLVIVYEKDSAPAKVRRAVESAGVMVTCLRPFDNQLPQYAQIFARGMDLKLSAQAAELLVSRHGGDLAAIANALEKISITTEKGAQVETADLNESGSARMPELFEIAESISAGRSNAALAQISRAIGAGREPVEILAVEVIPVMRRMMIAAAMLAERKSAGQIAGSLGINPSSPLATRAIEGARKFGLAKLERAYRRASELDAGFKNGQIKDREGALSALVLELTA